MALADDKNNSVAMLYLTQLQNISTTTTTKELLAILFQTFNGFTTWLHKANYHPSTHVLM